ncbi:hypothetical protein PGT21_010281 [Puccinia graminis f. sp. tritici]|uniref:Uncharacterized protein n=1 Tax=Puccinia graminis f. sp. tritici TaxID=56615 RepID=A0A5B0PE76_PUCGR|nr:hypothetical protein PGT21_010281 [Puccinia graminis f. sp. tritici]KAA1098658.1 hypothetical protein PGTUg99_013118 [Puccinia graminis f. sp. tritici]
MARNYDIIDEYHQDTTSSVPDCQDTLLEVIKVLQNDIRKGGGKINRFKLHFLWTSTDGEINEHLVQEHASNLNETDDAENNETNSNSPSVQLEI